jgi:hypothetical protein
MAEVVKRWVELCRYTGWTYIRPNKVVCFEQLDVLQLNLTLDMLRIYVKLVGLCSKELLIDNRHGTR